MKYEAFIDMMDLKKKYSLTITFYIMQVAFDNAYDFVMFII